MINNQSVDYGADLWALGIIVYRLFTGRYIFDDPSDYGVFEKIKSGIFSFGEEVPQEA